MEVNWVLLSKLQGCKVPQSNENAPNRWRPRSNEVQKPEGVNIERPKASRGRKDSRENPQELLPNIIEEGELSPSPAINSKRGAKLVQSILTLTELLSDNDLEILQRLLTKIY